MLGQYITVSSLLILIMVVSACTFIYEKIKEYKANNDKKFKALKAEYDAKISQSSQDYQSWIRSFIEMKATFSELRNDIKKMSLTVDGKKVQSDKSV